MNQTGIKMISQREKEVILRHNEGSAIVIAGPGAGKTTILAEKIVRLCQTSSVKSERIVAITFTNNAAEEMRNKINKLCAERKLNVSGVRISTIHALAKGLLHRYHRKLGLPNSFRVVNTTHEKMLLDDIRHDLRKQSVKLGRDCRKYLTRFKASKALVPDEIANSIAQIPSEDEKLAALKRFNCLYQKLLNYYKCIDWYDVVWLAVKLLRENSDVLREESSQIDYLLVDEYQDLNRADHTLIQLLSTHSKCLMVFGDDDQSIYETARFANPSGVKKFSDTYKSAKIYSLSVCWRCGAQIIDAAWGLIDRNLSDRMPKEKPLSSPERGEGEVIIIPLKSKKREIEYLCDELQRELRKEQPSESILVLFHSKRIGREYADALIRNGLRIENLLDSREEHSEALLLLYETLRFIISDGCDNLSARFLLEKWFKKSKDWIAEVRTQSIRENRPLWKMATEKMGKKGQLNSWEGKFKEWKQMVNSSKMLQSIIEFLGINEREEIKNILAQCEQDSNINLQSLLDCIEKGADVERQKAEAPNGDGDKSDVILMSMHGAKGLSADVVFIPALEDELMPNNWNESEQRRLLYVSMTRAKKRLIMSWAWSRRGKEIRRSANSSPIRRRRSRFLDDIEERVENYGKYQNSQS